MKKVKEMTIVIADDDVIQVNPETDVYRKMREEQEAFIQLIKDQGYVQKTDSEKLYDNVVDFILEKDLSFEDSLQIVHLLEQKYEVTKFHYEAEYDDYYDTNPNVLIWIKTK